MTADEVADTIEAAADLIRVNGLYKEDYWPNAGQGGLPGLDYQPGWSVCAYGALGVAQGKTTTGSIGFGQTVAELVLEYETEWQLQDWNDDDSTTQDDVVERFLDVAKRVRNGELDIDPIILLG